MAIPDSRRQRGCGGRCGGGGIYKDRAKAKGREEALKRHEQQRAEETRLAMAMNSATLQLCVVTANALTGGHNNGNVERAREAAQKAEKDYEAFIQQLAAKQVAKM